MDEKFELPDGYYSILDIQNYFKYITKKHEILTDKPTVRTYVRIQIRSELRLVKIRSGYYLELLQPETMKLLESTERRKSKDKNGENVPRLGNIEAMLFNCNIVNNEYQRD